MGNARIAERNSPAENCGLPGSEQRVYAEFLATSGQTAAKQTRVMGLRHGNELFGIPRAVSRFKRIA